MKPHKPITGVVKPVGTYRSWGATKAGKPIHEKREVILRGIKRHIRGEQGALRLERFDEELQAPVIRILYGTVPLPVFEGHAQAVIANDADREILWAEICDQIRSGAFDEEIEAVARSIYLTTTKRKVAV